MFMTNRSLTFCARFRFKPKAKSQHSDCDLIPSVSSLSGRTCSVCNFALYEYFSLVHHATSGRASLKCLLNFAGLECAKI